MFPTDRRHSKRKGSKVLLCVEMLKKYNEVNVAGTESERGRLVGDEVSQS